MGQMGNNFEWVTYVAERSLYTRQEHTALLFTFWVEVWRLCMWQYWC